MNFLRFLIIFGVVGISLAADNVVNSTKSLENIQNKTTTTTTTRGPSGVSADAGGVGSGAGGSGTHVNNTNSGSPGGSLGSTTNPNKPTVTPTRRPKVPININSTIKDDGTKGDADNSAIIVENWFNELLEKIDECWNSISNIFNSADDKNVNNVTRTSKKAGKYGEDWFGF